MNRSTDIDRSLWHHSPEHRFIPGATYMITASTRHRENFFSTTDRLILLRKTLFITIADRHWTLIAWALFSDHYHFIARAPDHQGSLKRLIQAFHSLSARSLNELDRTPGRRIWQNYWDRCLTFESSYYARLNYVNQNPVRHRLVQVSSQYPFCSARYFELSGSSVFLRRLASYRYDRVQEPDDFQPVFDPSD